MVKHTGHTSILVHSIKNSSRILRPSAFNDNQFWYLADCYQESSTRIPVRKETQMAAEFFKSSLRVFIRIPVGKSAELYQADSLRTSIAS